MSLGDQFRAFNKKAAAFRQELVGTDDQGSPVKIDYDRGAFPLTGYHTPLKKKRKTEEVGAWQQHDAIIRIPKATAPTGFLPEQNKPIKLTEEDGAEIHLTIDELSGFHIASAEWVLACKAST